MVIRTPGFALFVVVVGFFFWGGGSSASCNIINDAFHYLDVRVSLPLLKVHMYTDMSMHVECVNAKCK